MHFQAPSEELRSIINRMGWSKQGSLSQISTVFDEVRLIWSATTLRTFVPFFPPENLEFVCDNPLTVLCST